MGVDHREGVSIIRERGSKTVSSPDFFRPKRGRSRLDGSTIVSGLMYVRDISPISSVAVKRYSLRRATLIFGTDPRTASAGMHNAIEVPLVGHLPAPRFHESRFRKTPASPIIIMPSLVNPLLCVHVLVS